MLTAAVLTGFGGLGGLGGSAAAAPPAPQTGASAAAAQKKPRISLTLSEMKERTGGEFGLSAPMLLLMVRNEGEAVQAPLVGVDLILSVRLHLRRGERSEVRYPTLMRNWTVQTESLATGAELRQGLSPLSVQQRDLPLAPGRYRVTACVPKTPETAYPSPFTDLFGGLCSNELEIEIKRRR